MREIEASWTDNRFMKDLMMGVTVVKCNRQLYKL